jgi:enterochelin esterase-like enzyme
MSGVHDELLDLVSRLEHLSVPQAEAELRAFLGEHAFPDTEGDRATFFFWDEHPVDAVHLVHWVFGLESRIPFRRIGPTQAHWLSVELPHAGRIEYKIELMRKGRKMWVRDPLNPLQAFDPFGSNSVCPMPGYAEPSWAHPEPGARAGAMESFQIHSAVWGDTRTVQVYLPSEYRPDKDYPLVICHDGSDYLRYAALRTVLDNLITRHEVAPVIVAFVDGGARNIEYGAHPDHPRFIVDEVLPAIEARYRIEPGAENRGLMGASFGAVASAWTAWNRPHVFGRLLLQSGSFVYTDVGRHDRGPLWDGVVRFVNAWRHRPEALFADPAQARVFMSCGVFESLIQYNRGLAPLLRRAEVPVRFIEARDGHNWICWRDRLREGLSWLFPGHLWMYYE